MDTFNYKNKKLEYIPCNLCGSSNVKVLKRKSVNDLDVETVICKVCSLIYINPRMSAKDYDEYYMHFYRKDRSEIKQREYVNDLSKNFENARRFGRGIAKYMGSFLKPGLTIDVGSSTGGILYGLHEVMPELELLGVEPSLEESEYANQKQVKTIRGLFEDVKFDLEKKASNILCVQSLNHLLDPKKFLDWAHDSLTDEGHVFLAVKNWRHQVRRTGKLRLGVQVDHVYMFLPQTLKLLCENSGFEVVYLDVDEGKSAAEIKAQKEDGLNTHHIRIVAKRIVAETKFPPPSGLYLKTRIALHPLAVRAVYLFKYSKRLAFLRKLLHI